jgi:diacylglycerol kinase (ATP)
MRMITRPAEGQRPRQTRLRALVILNSESRHGAARSDEARTALVDRGFQLCLPHVYDRESVIDAIRRQGPLCDLVVVGGGDGSLNAALQGLVGLDVPLGILPLGTANDLARSLGIAADLDAACEVIAAGKTRRIDIGNVNDVYFFNEMGVGISPTVSRLLDKDAKAKFGVAAALPHALRVIRKMRRFSVNIRHGGEMLCLSTAQLTIGNGRSYGGFIKNEQASLDDHQLDLYSLPLPTWWSYLQALYAVSRGRPSDAAGVTHLQGRSFDIWTHKPRPVEADGEIVSMTPAHVRIEPAAIRVFAPDAP